jgi:hypothetical protein
MQLIFARRLRELLSLAETMTVLLLLVLLHLPCRGATYTVAPDGDDGNAGSVESPFASIQRAQEVAVAGDTVSIRGGTYRMSVAQIARQGRGRAQVILLNKSGSEGRPIRYWAHEGEQPVFDFSEVKPANRRVTAFQVEGSWLHLKGITVTGVQVTITRHTQSICVDNEGDHNVFERLTMRDGQAIGFWLGRGSDNLVLNCDAYRNHDRTSENRLGGNVDGFGFHVPKGSVNNVFRGCRAWFNSDDGFDFINTAEAVTVENCWAFYNGFDPEFKSLADGNGFKAGGYVRLPGPELPKPVPRHVVRKCVAVRNKSGGFYANHQPGGIDWLNNTAFRNGSNFNMLGRGVDDVNDVPGYGHRIQNNLGYKGRREVINLNETASDIVGNYFNLPVQIDDADFLSLDEAELVKPRQMNGDLPEGKFLRLAEGSDLIDCGSDVGLPFAGKAPDMGAFED